MSGCPPEQWDLLYLRSLSTLEYHEKTAPEHFLILWSTSPQNWRAAWGKMPPSQFYWWNLFPPVDKNIGFHLWYWYKLKQRNKNLLKVYPKSGKTMAVIPYFTATSYHKTNQWIMKIGKKLLCSHECWFSNWYQTDVKINFTYLFLLQSQSSGFRLFRCPLTSLKFLILSWRASICKVKIFFLYLMVLSV